MGHQERSNYEGPYPRIQRSGDRALSEVRVYVNHSKTIRGKNLHSKSPKRSQGRKPAKRGAISCFTAKSFRRARDHAHSCPNWTHFAVVKYGEMAPGDDRETKRHLRNLTARLRRIDIGGEWKQEFDSHRRPHFHFLLSGAIDAESLAKLWSESVGQSFDAGSVYAEPIHDMSRACDYQIKPVGDRQNKMPPRYTNMGRWWGSFGPRSKPEPLLVCRGPQLKIAKLNRALQHIRKSQVGCERRDSGFTSIRFPGTGGPSVATDLLRIALNLRGVEIETSFAFDVCRQGDKALPSSSCRPYADSVSACGSKLSAWIRKLQLDAYRLARQWSSEL